MTIQNTLYPAFVAATIMTEGFAFGVKKTDNDTGFKKIFKTVNDNRIPFGILTASLPLAIDSVTGGKPLNAIGMSLLATTSIIKLINENSQKTDNTKTPLEKIDTYSSHINALASGFSIGQNLLVGNPNITSYLPSLAFGLTALSGIVIPKIENTKTKKNATTASRITFAMGALLLGANLLKAGKQPQALLTLNLAALVLSTLHR
jgi:hypothetical protein